MHLGTQEGCSEARECTSLTAEAWAWLLWLRCSASSTVSTSLATLESGYVFSDTAEAAPEAVLPLPLPLPLFPPPLGVFDGDDGESSACREETEACSMQ